MASIEIPSKDTAAVIEISIDELEDQPCEEIIDILESEETNRSLYWQFALAYYKFGNHAAFTTMLESGLKGTLPAR